MPIPSPRSDQLDLVEFAERNRLARVLEESLAHLPEALAAQCKEKILMRPDHWWLGRDLRAHADPERRRLHWEPPGAGIVAPSLKGALELAALMLRRDGSCLRIYRPEGWPAFTLLRPPD